MTKLNSQTKMIESISQQMTISNLEWTKLAMAMHLMAALTAAVK